MPLGVAFCASCGGSGLTGLIAGSCCCRDAPPSAEVQRQNSPVAVDQRLLWGAFRRKTTLAVRRRLFCSCTVSAEFTNAVRR